MTGYNFCLHGLLFILLYFAYHSEKPFIETTQLLNIQALIRKLTNARSNKTAVSWCPTAETHMDKQYVSRNFHSGETRNQVSNWQEDLT